MFPRQHIDVPRYSKKIALLLDTLITSLECLFFAFFRTVFVTAHYDTRYHPSIKQQVDHAPWNKQYFGQSE